MQKQNLSPNGRQKPGKNMENDTDNKAVMQALDGLPVVKIHCSLLAEEAIHAALWDYCQKSGTVIEGLKPPKADINDECPL